MLSGETSVGKHPNQAVQTMARIVAFTEANGLERLPKLTKKKDPTTSVAVTRAAVDVARNLGVQWLTAFTETGRTARMMASARPRRRMMVFTPDPAVLQRLTVVWGVETLLVPFVTHTDEMVEQIDAELLNGGRAAPGDVAVLIAGVPPGVPGTVNGLRVHVIGGGATERSPG
jgi:pyruvate kinase